MFTDFVLNGQASGEVGEALAQVRYDPGLMRPYIDRKGHKCVTLKTNRMIFNEKLKQLVPEYKKVTVSDAIHMGFPIDSYVANATTLRKEEWIMFDTVVLREARQRLRAWSDLAAANSFSGFDGMSKTILEHETMSDPGVAVVDMDGLAEGPNDERQLQLEGLPLPITHSDFYFSQRKLAVSRNMGLPLDTTQAEAAGRRVAETIEQTLIGTITGITYGVAASYSNSPRVEGYTTHPDRLTKIDLTVPDGTNAATTLGEVLTMIQTLANQRFFGPFMLYHSTDWDEFMDDDYVAASPQNTLRERLRKIEAVTDVRRLDFLTSTFTLLLVQMTSDVARAVIGMDFTTVQWPTQGGMRQNFKVMTIQVPQIRSTFAGRSGIMHGTTA